MLKTVLSADIRISMDLKMKVTQIYLLLRLTLTASVLVDTFHLTGFIGELWQKSFNFHESGSPSLQKVRPRKLTDVLY